MIRERVSPRGRIGVFAETRTSPYAQTSTRAKYNIAISKVYLAEVIPLCFLGSPLLPQVNFYLHLATLRAFLWQWDGASTALRSWPNVARCFHSSPNLQPAKTPGLQLHGLASIDMASRGSAGGGAGDSSREGIDNVGLGKLRPSDGECRKDGRRGRGQIGRAYQEDFRLPERKC